MSFEHPRFSIGVGLEYRRVESRFRTFIGATTLDQRLLTSQVTPALVLRYFINKPENTWRPLLVVTGGKTFASVDFEGSSMDSLETTFQEDMLRDSLSGFYYGVGAGVRADVHGPIAVGGEIGLTVNAIRGFSHSTAVASAFNVFVQYHFGRK